MAYPRSRRCRSFPHTCATAENTCSLRWRQTWRRLQMLATLTTTLLGTPVQRLPHVTGQVLRMPRLPHNSIPAASRPQPYSRHHHLPLGPVEVV